MGSRNWMAPELLQGKMLKKPCDIYALGMTIYEVNLTYFFCWMITDYLTRFIRTKFRLGHNELLSDFIIDRLRCQAGTLDLNDQMTRMPPHYLIAIWEVSRAMLGQGS